MPGALTAHGCGMMRTTMRIIFGMAGVGRLLLAAVVVFAVFGNAATAAEGDGRFIGDLVFKQLNGSDGRDFVVQRRLTFVDPSGVHWSVPTGARTNCASVPRVAWSIFPPCAGRHLRAAVVHDHYCLLRNRSWKAVHRMFYHALRAAGVDNASAGLMYAAVYMFGPKWRKGGSTVRSARVPTPNEQKAMLNAMQPWIKSNNPTPQQIESHIRRSLRPQ